MDMVKLEKRRRRDTCILAIFIFAVARTVIVALIATIAESNPTNGANFTLWMLPFFILGAMLIFVIGMMYFYQKWSEHRDLSLRPLLGWRFLGEKTSMICGLLTVFFMMYIAVSVVARGSGSASDVAFLPALILGFITFRVLDANFVKIESKELA